MFRYTGLLLLFLLAEQVSAYEVVGYYYTGAINGKLAVQMDLHFSKSDIDGFYQYISTGKYLHVLGMRKSKTQVQLHEYDERADHNSGVFCPGTSSGTFTGVLTKNQHSFTGNWRSADGRRSFPFSLQAVAEYRRVTKTIKLDAQEEQSRKEEFRPPDRVVEEIVPFFYRATPALSVLNHQLWDKALADLKVAGKEEEYNMTSLGSCYHIQYLDARLLSLSVILENEGGGPHDYYTIGSENYLLAVTKPMPLTLDNLLTPSPALRAELLKKVRSRVRSLFDGEIKDFDNDKIEWEDIAFYVNAGRLTFCYPRYIGAWGSYDIGMRYVDLIPFLTTPSPLREYLSN